MLGPYHLFSLSNNTEADAIFKVPEEERNPATLFWIVAWWETSHAPLTRAGLYTPLGPSRSHLACLLMISLSQRDEVICRAHTVKVLCCVTQEVPIVFHIQGRFWWQTCNSRSRSQLSVWFTHPSSPHICIRTVLLSAAPSFKQGVGDLIVNYIVMYHIWILNIIEYQIEYHLPKIFRVQNITHKMYK